MTAATDIDTVARTLWGEARGDGILGMTAVANVICNRVNHASWWGSTFAGVCRARLQFSCWNTNDPNRAKLLAVTASDPQFAEALAIAAKAVAGTLEDTTRGATTYKTTSLPWPSAWGAPMVPLCIIGNQSFYNLSQRSQPTQKVTA